MSKRLCGVDDCGRPHHANGYCTVHAHRLRKHGDPLHAPRVVNADERLEDARWLAETGEGLTCAAERLGVTVKALEKFLRRHDRDCLASLIAHEPKDHNRIACGISIAELTGQTARRERRRKGARV